MACGVCDRLRSAAAAAVVVAGEHPVTMVELAAAAGIAPSEALGHCPEGAERVVADAYEEAAGELLGAYAASLHGGDSWPQKLTGALRDLLATLADEPAVAHLCFVAPVSGGTELRAIRERYRGRYIELMEVEQLLAPDAEQAPLSGVQLELMAGAIFRTISGLVGDGRAPELPALLEDVAGAAQVFEPRVLVTA